MLFGAIDFQDGTKMPILVNPDATTGKKNFCWRMPFFFDDTGIWDL
jgi:hypothetical protein